MSSSPGIASIQTIRDGKIARTHHFEWTFRKGPGYIWRIRPDGSVQHWTDLPDAVFMNGCTLHPNGHTLLACESPTGESWPSTCANPVVGPSG